ncbi:hypothetical protein [Maribacter aurantiacus]|uniref:SGNH/GDSL hydrolase family protein n=1 Tax=Maribacter aurantiacus TaxID=1882343 RepID=A0A5R8MAV8_9FLAO|nr:hypothetical protein [Maribacter aurantiacus]TLF46701.1 hypothetical protein FEK29_02685 [Maribacter aurantiacus]
MKAFLKKAAFFGLTVLTYFSATSIYNYTIDPYGIFGNRREFRAIRPNEHSLKTNFVLQNPQKFNSFLFSNSKGGVLHVNQLNTSEDSWYNMTYSLGTPEEFYNSLVLLLENGVQVNNIILGMDEGVIYERTSSHENDASRKFVNLQEDKIQWEFLFLPISIKKILGADLSKKYIEHDIYTDGNYYAHNAYEADCISHENLELVDFPHAAPIQPLDFSSQIEILEKIRSLCGQKGIQLTFLVHPSSFENYVNSTERRMQFEYLLKTLENKGFKLFRPYGAKLMRMSPCYWLDKHHYTQNIGNVILQEYSKNWANDSIAQ